MLLKRDLVIPILSLLLSTSQSTGQVNVNGYLSAGYPVYAVEEYYSIYRDWKFTLGGGAVMEYHPSPSIIIGPSVSYQYVFINERDPETSADWGRVSSTGTGSQIFQVGAEFVVHKSRERLFDPQFILGGGYQWVDFGTMTNTWIDLDGSTLEYSFSPESINGWYFTLGLGGALRISSDLFINTTAKLVNSFNLWQSVDSNDLILSASFNYRFI